MKYFLLISFLLPLMTWAQVPETAASEEFISKLIG